MFKKLRNRVADAINGASSSSSSSGSNQEDPVRRLQVMLRPQTVSDADARGALAQCGGNVELAAERLLLEGAGANRDLRNDIGNDDELQRALQASLQVNNPQSPVAAPASAALRGDNDDDAEIQRALQASLQQEPHRPQTAASRNAGRAALARFEMGDASSTPSPSSANGVATLPSVAKQLQKHHPNVVVPKTVQQDKKDQQILRLADRLASYAPAVDTLHKALTALKKNPENTKFHTINASTPGFQRSLGPVPPSLLKDWLAVVQYHSADEYGSIYHLSFVDHATLYLAVSALERVQSESVTYRTNKRQWKFQRSFQTIAGKEPSLLRTTKSAASGTGTWITVTIGEEKSGGDAGKSDANAATSIGSTVRRRFDGDDVVMDVLNWIASGNRGVLDALTAADGPWCVWDKNASAGLDCADPKVRQSTLQSVNWWPSGRLHVTMRDIIEDSKIN